MKQFTFTAFLFIQGLLISQNPVSFVNPFIGTGGHGHTFPGATVPFGMVQLSPDTRIDNSWDGCGGYHYSDSVMYGFSHTHLSGTGCSDYGDIAVLPFMAYKPGDKERSDKFDYKNYAQRFVHSNEKASAGYYSVKLENGITAELTTTTRVGIYQYLFPANEQAKLIIQLDHRDKTLESDLKTVGNKRIEGFRRSEAWAKDQYIYFVMDFSEPFTGELSNVIENKEGVRKFLFQTVSFGKLNGKPLIVKVGISNVSIEGARKNLEAEATHWDFNQYKTGAEASWNKELSKIKAVGKNKDDLVVFYTALYHTMTQPNTAMDVDGMYRGRDNQIHKAVGFTYYTVFSLWDTFRAAHPLYTIIDPKRASDFINTFLAQYEQSGRLPMWELSSNETNCMIGYHSVSVIADAIGKNIGGFDKMKAYQAMVAAASYTEFGIPLFNKNNYLQVDDEQESVSKTLEYAYDDWCIAMVAQKLNKTADYNYFIKKAQAYKNLYDKQTGFMRPRKNGNWLSPFDPTEVNNHFTEANSWQYTFFVPQDIEGLIKLMGGDKAFESKLDELFSTSSKTTGREQADITGLIGQYAHGNEPSHHMAYLYDYVGKPDKTEEKVEKIMTEFYKNAPDGLIGNEDCGQMSAWYVMSAMGFYPVCPGTSDYVYGKPFFDSLTIHLENKKEFIITRKAAKGSGDLKYVTSVSLNGRPLFYSGISHQAIMNGGSLVFNMDAHGESLMPRPPHRKILEESMVPAPVINTSDKVFKDKEEVGFETGDANTQLFYTLNGVEPTKNASLYKGKFTCDSTTTIKVKAYTPTDSSVVTVARIYKKPNNWTVKINSTYNKQYTAGGDNALIDGIRGDVNWRKGEWQGYQAQDFECVVDLGKSQSISYYMAGFLQDSRAWILFPTKVEFYVSADGKKYELMETLVNTIKAEDQKVQTQDFIKSNKRLYTGRYVKVKAYNYGKLPEWHQGASGDAFIFIDEIEIK